MRYTIVSSAALVLLGLLLVVSSLYMVPYMVREQIRVERSKTWLDEEFVLYPNEIKIYLLDSVMRNSSIFQIDLYPSSQIVLSIVNFVRNETVFEWLRGGEIFWTPPSRHDVWRFIFGNPSDVVVSVNTTVTEYYLKVNESKYVTYFHSYLDPAYGYLGVGLVMAGVVLNFVCSSRPRNGQPRNSQADSSFSVVYSSRDTASTARARSVGLSCL